MAIPAYPVQDGWPVGGAIAMKPVKKMSLGSGVYTRRHRAYPEGHRAMPVGPTRRLRGRRVRLTPETSVLINNLSEELNAPPDEVVRRALSLYEMAYKANKSRLADQASGGISDTP